MKLGSWWLDAEGEVSLVKTNGMGTAEAEESEEKHDQLPFIENVSQYCRA